MAHVWTDTFGELRSLAHGEPSSEAWAQICGLARRCDGEDAARWREEAALYLRGVLARWPAALCQVDAPDVWRWRRDGLIGPTHLIARAVLVEAGGQLAQEGRGSALWEHAWLERVEHLQLESAGVDLPHWEALLGSSRLRALRHMVVGRCSFGASGVARLAQSATATQLETLELDGCHLGRHGGYALRHLRAPRLASLSLVGCYIGAAGLRALAQLTDLSPARLTLDARDLWSRDAGAALVSAAPLLSRVRDLSIKGATLPWRFPLQRLVEALGEPLERLDMPMDYICNLRELSAALAHPNLSQLRELSVCWGSARLGALLDAPLLAGLRALRLSATHLRDEDAVALAAHEPLRGLTRLRLDDVQLSPAALRVLLGSSSTGPALRAAHPEGAVSHQLWRWPARATERLTFEEVLR